MQSHVQYTSTKPAKYRSSRPNDYIYDPTFVVSSPRDYQRCILQAAKEQAEFQPQPNFPSMFSDHPRYPCMRWSLKHVDRVPAHINRSFAVKQMALIADSQKEVDVSGIHRHFFFGNALVQHDSSALSTQQLEENIETSDTLNQSQLAPETRSRSVQTEYRESAAQTTPWAPPYFIGGEGSTPEILTLAMLSWENGLPAGMHEVEIIERLRIKRAWEKVLPPMDNPENIKKRKDILEAIERDEWSFREKEIEAIHKMHFELTKHLFDDTEKIFSTKMAERLDRVRKSKEKEKEIKINKINLETNRALRKLAFKHKGVNMRYHKQNVIDEYTDKTSELYGPLMRYGENPKRRHEVIKIQSNFLSQMKGLEILERMPKWIPTFDFIRAAAPKTKRRELCIHETRWTDEVLTKLYKDLKAIRMALVKGYETGTLRLVKKIHQQKPLRVSASIEGIRDSEETMYQSAIFLQAVIKGRAIQLMMSEGRDKCQELIEDYKRSKSLYDSDIPVFTDRLETRMLQREQAIERDQDNKWLEVCSYLEGLPLSGILNFLLKEMTRLQDERQAHAFALLAERERTLREAAEAERRQAEERRRREHDEVFKQLMKVHQDTVETYLEDIILESMDWMAKSEAKEYIREVAQRVDHAAEEAHIRNDIIEQEELVSSLIHTFVIPEVEKIQARKQIIIQQEKYLRAAHAAIYDSDEEEMDGVSSVSTSKIEDRIDSTENSTLEKDGAVLQDSCKHCEGESNTPDQENVPPTELNN